MPSKKPTEKFQKKKDGTKKKYVVKSPVKVTPEKKRQKMRRKKQFEKKQKKSNMRVFIVESSKNRRIKIPFREKRDYLKILRDNLYHRGKDDEVKEKVGIKEDDSKKKTIEDVKNEEIKTNSSMTEEEIIQEVLDDEKKEKEVSSQEEKVERKGVKLNFDEKIIPNGNLVSKITFGNQKKKKIESKEKKPEDEKEEKGERERDENLSKFLEKVGVESKKTKEGEEIITEEELIKTDFKGNENKKPRVYHTDNHKVHPDNPYAAQTYPFPGYYQHGFFYQSNQLPQPYYNPPVSQPPIYSYPHPNTMNVNQLYHTNNYQTVNYNQHNQEEYSDKIDE